MNLLKQNYVNYEDEFDDTCIPHFCLPSLNNYFEKDNCFYNVAHSFTDGYKKLPYCVTSALPFSQPALLGVENLNGIDPATKLVSDKKNWETHKDKIIFANLGLNRHQIIRNKSKLFKRVPLGRIKLAEHLKYDPDPYFNNRYMYNWYYTGGNLNIILYKNNYFLLSTCINTPGFLNATRVNITENDCFPLENKKLFFGTNDGLNPVFQTVVNNNFIGIRQKNSAALYTFHYKGKLKFKKIHESCESESTIVSLDIHDGEYSTLSTCHTLKIWSPDKTDCKFSHKFNIDRYCNDSCDHWGCIKYISNNNFLLSLRNCVYLKDRRTSLNADLKWWTPISKLKCDNISLLTKSFSNDNTAYIGTKHSLFRLDLRQSYDKEWTHMMEYTPVFGTSCPIIENSETVFIGSQNVNEVCIFESDVCVMPYLSPSPNEMVENAKLKGMCLDPKISTRCNFSMVGLTSIPFKTKNKRGAFIFRSTSIGDVFYQKIIEDDNIDYTESDKNGFNKELISVWEEKCLKSVESFIDKPLEVTKFVDKSETCKILLSECKKNEKIMSKKIKKKFDENIDVLKDGWSISKKRLLEEDSPLGQCLLDEWDIEDEEEWCVKKMDRRKLESFGVEEVTDHNSKIDSWFSHLSTTPVNNKISDNCINLKDTSKQTSCNLNLNDSLNIISKTNEQRVTPSTSKTNHTYQGINENFLTAFGSNENQNLIGGLTNFNDSNDIFDDNDFTAVGNSRDFLTPVASKKKVMKPTSKNLKFSSGF